MKTLITNPIASLRIHLWMKRALIGAACGLGLLSTAAFGQGQQLYLDCAGTSPGSVAAPAGFTKLNLSGNNTLIPTVTFANVASSAYTLTVTNVGAWNGGGTTLQADGWFKYTPAAGFTLSGLPAGYTVALYAIYGWDGSGAAAKFIYGGTTNVVVAAGTANPGITNFTFVGRAVVDGSGNISGTWIGNGGQGQVGAMIFDIEPCQPVITMNGLNPQLVPVNSTFHDPGATAVEGCSGSALTVTTNGTVDSTTIGTYTRTYTAIADGITNTATRTVNVVVSDYLNLDLANANNAVPTPVGFNRLNYSTANMTFSEPSIGGTTYTVNFTNVGGTWNGGGGTIDQDGYFCNGGATDGFSVSGLTPGSLVTLYACWAWDQGGNAAVITYGGSSTTLTVGTGIAVPSSTTLQNVGTAVADGSGVVRGTWTGKTTGNQGQIGGMIFGIQAPVAHNITILPTGVTNSCGSSATFLVAAPSGATYQWYNNFGTPITGATNTTLVLTNLHPSASGNYNFIATATNASWSATNFAVVSIYDVTLPVMTMSGNSVITIAKNGTWSDPGVTAYDTCAGNYLTVTTNGTVNTSVAGQYNLTYLAVSGDNVSNSIARSVYVIDPADIQPDVQLALDFQSTSDGWGTSSGFTAIQLFDVGQGTSGNASVTDPTGISSSLVLSFTNISSWNQSPYLGYSTISTAGFYNYNSNGVFAPATFNLSGLPANAVVNIYAVYGWNGTAKAAKIIYAGATNLLTTGVTTNSPNPPTQANFQFIGSALANNGTVSGTWYGPTGPASEGDIGGMIINIQSYPAHSAVISPASVTPQCGSNVTFTATASGGGTFTYQWYDNNTNLITGATNATYTLANVRATSAGNYTVVVGNAYGSATNFATVTGVFDSQAPIMALSGPSTLNVLVNSAYVDAGASAYDLCAQGSLSMTTNSTVDTTTIGSYTVTYSATTASGTPGQIVRTVNVTAIPNLSLNLDFAPNNGTIQPAPSGFTKVESGASLAAMANYNWPSVAGSIYTLSISNISQYNTGNAAEPLATDGFYKFGGVNTPATFALSGLQQYLKVTLYAIYAWDGGNKYANVFFGGTNAQIVYTTDPGTAPTLANFTRIGSAIVGPSGTVNGYWQGPGAGGTNAEGQVGGMIFVIGTNTPPVASNMVMNAVGAHSAALQIVGNPSGPTDPDGDPLTLTAVQTNIGAVTISGNNVIYTAPGTYSGVDTFNYTVSDGFGGISTGTVTVTVASNSPPVVSAISLNATNGLSATLKIIGGASAPTDADGDAMLVTAVQNPSDHGGTVTTDGTNTTYVSSYVGTDHFTYTVGDGHGGFSTATVTVTVASTHQPPVAGPQVMGAVSGQAATLKIIGGANPPTDPDGDTLTVTAVTTPANGTAGTDGTYVTYTSANGFAGSDAFSYVVGDGHGAFATNTVTVKVVSAASYNQLGTPVLSGGNYNVTFVGIPYAYYVLLNTPSLTAPVTWSPVVTNQADGNSGVINFSFTPSAGAGFYKTGSLP